MYKDEIILSSSSLIKPLKFFRKHIWLFKTSKFSLKKKHQKNPSNEDSKCNLGNNSK